MNQNEKNSAIKHYLNKYAYAVSRISRMTLEIERMKTQAVSISVSTDGERVQSSGSGDKVQNAVIRYIDAEASLSKMKADAQVLRVDILNMIYNLDDKRYTDILIMRYIDRYSYERIARRMNYSTNHVKKLHNKALTELDKLT